VQRERTFGLWFRASALRLKRTTNLPNASRPAYILQLLSGAYLVLTVKRSRACSITE